LLQQEYFLRKVKTRLEEIAHMMETVWLGCCSKNIS